MSAWLVTHGAVLCIAWLGVAVIVIGFFALELLKGAFVWIEWLGYLRFKVRDFGLELGYLRVLFGVRCSQTRNLALKAFYRLLIFGVLLRMRIRELDGRWMDFYLRHRVACWAWTLAIWFVLVVAESAPKPETNLGREQQAHDDRGDSAAGSGGPRK